MRMHCIIHADFEQPGYYETWARGKGIEITTTRIYKDGKLPSPKGFDILLSLGGPQSPFELNKFPYLIDEIQFIKEAIDCGRYVIGVCLGAQLIAESFGAKTEHSPHKEIGVFPVTLTEDGKRDLIFKNFPAIFPSAHWHNDMPGIPSNAKIIATSKGCPRQIIKFSPQVYGLQCHLEFDKKSVRALINNCSGDLTTNGYVQSADGMLSQDYDEINNYLKTFLQNFIFQNKN